MAKIKLDNMHTFGYPMPVTLIGVIVEGRANFMPASWITRLENKPPLIGVALGRHYTNRGIEEHGEFSVNVPGVELLEATDYCGLVSGAKTDKSSVFETFAGALTHAPMIAACPVTLECTLYQRVALPAHVLYIGEVISVYSEECYLTRGQPDEAKTHPFMLTMPHNGYWALGERVGQAWHSGKKATG